MKKRTEALKPSGSALNNEGDNVEGKIDFQWTVMEQIASWILAADNKATALLAIAGVIIGFILTSAFELARDPNYTPLTSLLNRQALIILVLSVVSLAASCISAFFCLTGRTGANRLLKRLLEPNIVRSNSTIIYFGRIAQYSKAQYVNEVRKSDDSLKLVDLAEQTYILAQIATEKYRWLNRVYTGMTVSVLFFIVLGVVILL